MTKHEINQNFSQKQQLDIQEIWYDGIQWNITVLNKTISNEDWETVRDEARKMINEKNYGKGYVYNKWKYGKPPKKEWWEF